MKLAHVATFLEQRKAYVPWTTVQSSQIGDAILSPPNIPRDSVTMVNLTANLSPFDFIDSREVSMVFGDICERYNSSLNELITPVISESQSSKFKSLEFIWIICLTITMLGLIGWTSSMQITILKLLIRPTGELPTPQLPEITISPEVPGVSSDSPDNSDVNSPPEYSKTSLSY